jgi:hypothetical protein
LDVVTQEMGQVEAALARLGQLEEDLHASEETLARLNAETAKLRSNSDSLDKTKRISRLRDNAAAIDLEQGDIRLILEDIAATKEHVRRIGGAARASGAVILSELANACRKDVRQQLEALLDFSVIHNSISEGLEAVGPFRPQIEGSGILLQRQLVTLRSRSPAYPTRDAS